MNRVQQLKFCRSDFVLWRQQVVAKTNTSPYAGNYTFRLSPPLATNNALTDGSGFGTMTVSTKGLIKWTAVLANQAKSNQLGVLIDPPSLQGQATVLKGGRWSFYVPSKSGDALTGEMTFTTNGTFAGDVKWFAPGFVGLTNLATQTNQNVKMNGARYTPATSAPPFNWTNGVLTISGGGLAEPIVTPVQWQTNGAFLISSNPHHIQLFVTNATGFIGGSFTPPGSNTLARLRGAVLQSSNSAAGYVPHLPRHGGFELRRAP